MEIVKYSQKDLRYYDWMVGVIIILMISTRLFTVGYVALKAESTKADIDNVVKVYESNPLAKLLLTLSGLTIILFNLVIPAFVTALYILMRKRVQTPILGFYVNFFFFLMIMNVLNDMVIFIATLI